MALLTPFEFILEADVVAVVEVERAENPPFGMLLESLCPSPKPPVPPLPPVKSLLERERLLAE